ncbi:MMPL family transporter [Alkalicoccus halolimnae]|uniref:MMPL family transporter n=1 Tax=Alkalicoccus halolimnae TaxID=1667239 RepID=A0A5C7FHM3_9BACI|nr:MMPL family transporter [Alkalicoccus halolimnae]TXF85784.1 MMPL family transporter [Alkalicoccus halolimnae]
MHRLLYVLPFLWIAVGAWLFLTSPDMDQLVRERGQFDIPDEYQTAVTSDILQANEGSAGEEILLVYFEENGLSDSQLDSVAETLDSFPSEIEGFPIEEITTPFDSEENESLISDDETTLMAVLSMDMTVNDVPEVRPQIEQLAADPETENYVSGAAIVEDDVIISSEEGLATTEIITVIFVITILLFVFRSVTAPLIPLITVGAAYLVTVPIVSFLIERMDFPVSNFTQIFIVAILFGIGTDYCILLMNRFKEELARHPVRKTAVIETYRAVGPTVFSSALTGFIGFAAIGLADFDLYQSAAGVAVGIVMLVLALIIWVPPAMLLLGDKLFWPSKRALESTDSRIWKGLGTFSMLRPGWTSLILIALVVPSFLFYDQRVSFHSLDEISGETDSVEAIDLVSERFGVGYSFPAQIVLEAEEDWDDPDMLPIIEYVSAQVASIEEVEEVRSFTRPDGVVLDDFRIPEITGELRDGVDETVEGVEEVTEGLEELQTSLREEESAREAAEGSEELADGSGELQTGLEEAAGGLEESTAGIRDIAASQNEIATQLAELEGSLEEISSSPALDASTSGAIAEISAGMGELENGLNETAEGTNEAASGQEELEEGIRESAEAQSSLQEGQEELTEGFNQFGDGFLEIADSLDELIEGLEEIEEGLGDVSSLLAETADQETHPLEGFFVPEEAADEEEFHDLAELYTTPNSRVATFDVVLDIDPYSNEAMVVMDEIDEQVSRSMNEWPDRFTYSLGGLPAVNADLSEISDNDFFRTAVIMLSGIFLVLIVMLRSLIMPVYILASLIATYVISMAVTELIFVTILGYPGISWAVPFFGFVMLMALGVDYSIFLMARFAENMKHQGVNDSLMTAMTKIGTVILSAAIILAGTFGAMMPSGVLSLVQIGTLVLTGLLLYAFVMLPLFIPLMIRLFGDKNWLPFKAPGKK